VKSDKTTYFDLLRNYQYTFRIDNITSAGFDTPADAYSAVPVYIKIEAGEQGAVVDWAEVDFGVDTSDMFSDKLSFYKHGELYMLMEASQGTGIDLVIVGDGYTGSDMKVGGKYEADMIAAANNFFSIYPYSAYLDWFNVYMSVAVSKQKGISKHSLSDSNSWQYPDTNDVDTFFKTTQHGGGTGITANSDLIRSWSANISAAIGKGGDINQMTMLMPINADIYAGTCSMYAAGFSVAWCPVSTHSNPRMDFRALVVHETCGHGFAKLADEYITNSGTIPSANVTNLLALQMGYGFYPNVDVNHDGANIGTNGIADTSWSGFAGQSGYDMVGAWEGGYYYTYGVWRPEFNSCMNNNVLYFNAPSRYAIIKQIHRWGGTDSDYTLAEFIADDIRPAYPATTRSSLDPNFQPLGAPIVVMDK
jgi:hypothetical protein